MTPTLTVRSEEFERAMRMLESDLTGGDRQAFVEDEAGRIVKLAVRLTAPKTRKQGRGAVERDVDKVVRGYAPDFVRFLSDAFGETDIDETLRNKAGGTYRVQIDEISTDAARIEAFHQSKRDKRGRVKSRGSRARGDARGAIVTTKRLKREYLRKLWARVGVAKAGWLPSARALGVKLPAWVSRHSGSLGYLLRARDGNRFGVTMRNDTVSIPDYERLIDSVFKGRAKAMTANIRRMVRGGANKYGFRVRG